ncbi:MAG: alpha/beta hydrolase [Thermoanaerobaculales bacterium]|nr:alpha/beta hydrolase [Thermoanaerobaculales bacterium]
MMPQAHNGDVTIHYEDEGSGEPVLLIHGHTMDRRIWDPVMPGFRNAGLRILRPDLRGHGLSTRPDFGYHMSHHASDMAAVLDDAGTDSATVVGYSIGGGVALEMALTLPNRLSGLVLMSPVMPDRPFEAAFMDNLREVARVARSEGIEAAMRGPWASNPLFEFSFSKPGIRETAAAINRDFPGAEYLATQRDRIERDWTVPERLSEIDVATVVLAGDRETPGFRAYAEEAAEGIPGARIEFFENCGHLLPLEEPDRVAKAIIDVVRLGRA